MLEKKPPGGDYFPYILLDRFDMEIMNLDEGLRHAEEADHDGDKMNPGHEAHAPEGKSSRTGETIHPDHAEKDTEGSCKNPLRQRLHRRGSPPGGSP